nr:MAG TPA: hypothetical protein [Caudoviricetes sp.]
MLAFEAIGREVCFVFFAMSYPSFLQTFLLNAKKSDIILSKDVFNETNLISNFLTCT